VEGRESEGTYLEIFRRLLLVSLGHRRRRLAGKLAHDQDDAERGADAVQGVESHDAAFVRGGQGTGAVRAEGDPVRYPRRSSSAFYPDIHTYIHIPRASKLVMPKP